MVCCILAACLTAVLDQPAPRLALRDGERIVFLGSALVEQEQFHGYLETRLLRQAAGKKIVCRNLGWSGDTVRGVARTSGYQNPEGMARLLREVKAQQPTLLFVGYGMNESFAGRAGLDPFLQGYRQLLDELASLKARIVILSPTPHEDLGRPYPEPTEHNRDLAIYGDALRELARQRGAIFVDLFQPLRMQQGRYTTNGILLNDAGYRAMAVEVERQLGLPETKLEPADEKLRAAIVQRNEIYYRRWRPFNDHSRHWGFMAKDFKLYDDEVAAQEKVIDELRLSAPGKD
jgi:lysophospholipase L1-like esterase